MKEPTKQPEQSEALSAINARIYRLQRRQAIVRSVIFLLAFSLAVTAVFGIAGVAGIQGISMEPTLCPGDTVFFLKTVKEPQVGDIIVYRTSDGKRNIKRVVAVAGDSVSFSGEGELIINGQAVEESYVFFSTFAVSDLSTKYIVPRGAYYVLGDHRDASVDSRETGAIAREDIVGKVIFSINSQL